ncbi:hypothetical protein GcM3_027032 [Golovinomyces cichoracearum]|uniref:DUF7053 domain-containing protein n=1 Tax=Golovinomyces cichoracearum TaxID=62708 RepID=A0A420J5V2_9PEZI|nr:hypothetical protein GcM3_027032 [Golovinomyces cichoracearum]
MPSKRFTTVTPLPLGISRDTILDTLHDHLEMIDLNLKNCSRNSIPAPASCTPEEMQCSWYQIIDRITVCPGFPQKSVTFNVCFHDLTDGSQIHCYAPMGLDIKQKWSIGGNAPGEQLRPIEIGIGAPAMGLYIRDDVELKGKFLASRFLRHTFKKALKALVERLLSKAHLAEATQSKKNPEYDHNYGHKFNFSPLTLPPSPPLSLLLSPPLGSSLDPHLSTDSLGKKVSQHQKMTNRFSVPPENKLKSISNQQNYNGNMSAVELPS